MASPKDVHTPIPRTCEFVLTATVDCAGVIPLKILRWGDDPGLSGWAQCDNKGPHKREAGESELEKRCGYGSRGWSDAMKGHEPRDAGGTWKLAMTGKGLPPRAFTRNQPC